MKIFIGADHAGFDLKEKIKKYLQKNKIFFEDVGAHKRNDNDDYPDYALKVAKKVSENKKALGILICGTGTGMAIAANKIRGIRAVSAKDAHSAGMARQDNDANVLGLQGKDFPYEEAEKIVAAWLKTPFSKKERHKRRLRKIKQIEDRWKR